MTSSFRRARGVGSVARRSVIAVRAGAAVLASCTLVLACSREANRAGPVDARVLQAYRQLSTLPLHEPPTMTELAARNGLGRKHLERLFCSWWGWW